MESELRFTVLNACPACGRQYDVSHLGPGGRVRCACGTVFAAEFRQPHSPRALQCSHCGGALRIQASACEWCSAEITLEERRLSAVCPLCFARMSTEARFCMECGVEIAVQSLLALAEDASCPRCASGLRSRDVGSVSVVECERCGGLWLTEERFESLCERADASELEARGLGSRAQTIALEAESKMRYLPCVACKQLMMRKNYASSSGVVLDVCSKHGVWLDHGELEKILAFIRQGGLDRARQRELERLRMERQRLRDESQPHGLALDIPHAGGSGDLAESLGGELVVWIAKMLAGWRR